LQLFCQQGVATALFRSTFTFSPECTAIIFLNFAKVNQYSLVIFTKCPLFAQEPICFFVLVAHFYRLFLQNMK